MYSINKYKLLRHTFQMTGQCLSSCCLSGYTAANLMHYGVILVMYIFFISYSRTLLHVQTIDTHVVSQGSYLTHSFACSSLQILVQVGLLFTDAVWGWEQRKGLEDEFGTLLGKSQTSFQTLRQHHRDTRPAWRQKDSIYTGLSAI